MGRPTRSSRDRESSTNDDLGGLRRRGTAKHALYFGHCKCLDMSAHHPCPPLRTPTVPWHAEWIYDREGPLYSKSKGPDCNRTYMVSGYVKKDHWWQTQRGNGTQEAVIGGRRSGLLGSFTRSNASVPGTAERDILFLVDS